MKSYLPVKVYLHIYGSVLIQFLIPPSSGYFAYMSPNVRVTDSLPGKTRNGPNTT